MDLHLQSTAGNPVQMLAWRGRGGEEDARGERLCDWYFFLASAAGSGRTGQGKKEEGRKEKKERGAHSTSASASASVGREYPSLSPSLPGWGTAAPGGAGPKKISNRSIFNSAQE